MPERWASVMVSLNLGWKTALKIIADTELERTARNVFTATACKKTRQRET